MEGKILRLYISYLIKCGILSTTNIADFISVYQTTSKSFQSSSFSESLFKEKISQTFLSFILSLSHNKLLKMGINLFYSFFTHYNQTLNSSLLNLLHIFHKSSLHNFLKWKQHIHHNNNINPNNISSCLKTTIPSTTTSPISNRIHFHKNNNSTRYKSPQRFLMNASRSNKQHHQHNKTIENSQYLKEKDELSHCTFKPDIKATFDYYNNNISKNTNGSNILGGNTNSVHNRLYTEHKKMLDRREARVLEKTANDAKTATFKPKFVSSPPKIKYNNFIERLKNFENKKNENRERILSEIEHDCLDKCSFSPNIEKSQRKLTRAYTSTNYRNGNNSVTNHRNISQSFNNNENIPAYERLYEYNKIKKQNLKRKQQEIDNEIKIMALSPSVKNYMNVNDVSSQTVDYRKIESLYNDYKRVKIKMKQKRDDLDIEQGITFKPEMYTNEKYYDKIPLDFHAREIQFMEDKKKHVNERIQENESQLNEQRLGGGKYSNKEKEEITNNIINRLYKKGLEKYTERRGVNLNTHRNSVDNINNVNVNEQYTNNVYYSNEDNDNSIEYAK